MKENERDTLSLPIYTIYYIQWKPLNRDASGVKFLSRISDYPDYPM